MQSARNSSNEPREHAVQFYVTESFLADTVAEFVVEGLRNDETAIIVATEAHRHAFTEALRVKGMDVDSHIVREQIVMLDAAATMDAFMVDGVPDAKRFELVIGRQVAALTRGGTRNVRAYGEIVDLLWRAGQHDAAIHLEEMWNELRSRHPFKLFCAYAINSFDAHDGATRVCATHSHVRPPEAPPGNAIQTRLAASLHAMIAEIARRTSPSSLQQLRAAEAEARRAKEDLEDFLDNAAIPIHRVDRDGIIRYVNRAEMDLLGYRVDELVGHHIGEFHVDRDTAGEILARLNRGETVRDFGAQLRAKDHSVRYVEITSNAQTRGGEFVSSRCFTRDVTPVRQTAALHKITAALSRALTAEQVAKIVIAESRNLIGAPAGGVLLVNDDGTAIERFIIDGNMHRSTAEAVTVMPLSADLPICEAARTNKLVWVVGTQALDARYPHLAAMRAAGNVHTWGAVPVNFEGRTLGAIGFRCSYERPLAPDEETMLLAVASQCALALDRARLHDAAQLARDEAERASRAKDEFLAMLGHELRNPLAPILTAVQLMRLRGDDVTAREQNIIERQVNHLIHLVDDLLDISRIAQGKVQLDKRPVKLASVVSKAVEIVAPSCEERRHQLSVDVPREDLWLEADETRLCQVLTNLLINAVKYTNPGGQLEVRVAHDGDSATISIKDNGNGIGPDLLPRIFDLFVQGQRTPDRSHGGLGIGLALVRSLVAMHGGAISASSEGLGRGSEFVVRLPLLDLRKVATPSDVDRSIRRRVEVTPRRILVVDDNQDAAELLAELLRSIGHDVIVAHDGERALDMLKHFTPEIAILDIGLPDTDGYQLARSLRARLGTTVRLMAVTGYGQPKDVVRAQLAGFDQHFTKPVGLGKIIAAIEVDRTNGSTTEKAKPA
jgi:PAS domain S-box-containing protein